MVHGALNMKSHTSRNETRKCRNESEIYRNYVVLSEYPRSNPGLGGISVEILVRNSEEDEKIVTISMESWT